MVLKVFVNFKWVDKILFMINKQNTNQSFERPLPINGYLKKMGEKGLKSFKKRYFRQEGEKIFYYVDETDLLEQSKGFIDLKEIKQVKKKSQTSFELISKNRTYLLEVLNNDIEIWMKKFSNWIDYFNTENKPKLSIQLTNNILTVSSINNIDCESNSPKNDNDDEKLELEISNILPQIEQLQALIEKDQQEINLLNERAKALGNRSIFFLEEESKKKLNDIKKEIENIEPKLDEANSSLISNERLIVDLKKELAILNEKNYSKELMIEKLDELNLKNKKESEEKKEQLELVESSRILEKKSENENLTDLIKKIQLQINKNTLEQIKNSNLNQNLTNISFQIESQAKSFESIQDEFKLIISSYEKKLQSIRNDFFESQNLSPEFLSQFEELRANYFSSLLISLKLEAELFDSTNVPIISDIRTLYSQVLLEKPDHTQWFDWVNKSFLMLK